MPNFSNIKLFVYDFDGVMTDNRVLVLENNLEAVFCNRSDGLAINEFKKFGILQIIFSTEVNKIVKVRADKLKIELIQGVENKLNKLIKYLKNINIKPSQVLYVGNDINDMEAMQICKLKVCPKDAAVEIKKISDIILTKKGGEGVIRELLDIYRKHK